MGTSEPSAWGDRADLGRGAVLRAPTLSVAVHSPGPIRIAPTAVVVRDRAAEANPIILLSARARSGSVYLESLLSLHPACRKGRVPEDFFLANSATLLNFCRSLTESWEADWYLHDRAGDTADLAASFGAAMLRLVVPQGSASGKDGDYRLLLRSPATDGIDAATTLFPDAKLIVLVRDGPATVESGRRSFGWRYDMAMRGWRDSVRRIFAAIAADNGERFHLVRYEDLVRNPAREIAQILDFLGLDQQLYPHEQVGAVPVLGSSTFGRVKGKPVHWQPMARDPSFDPLRRAQSWPTHRFKRFTWLAEAELQKLGYPVQPLSLPDRLWNVARDVQYRLWQVIFYLVVLRLRQPRIFSDRQRRYFSWRKLNN